VKDIG